MFEEINLLYLASTDAEASQGLRPYTAMVQRDVAATIGLYDNTVLFDEGREWLHCGMFIERADMTSRIIDAKYYMLLPSLADVDGPLDRYHWLAILRSASAHEAFRKRYRGSIRASRVAELLMLDPAFPRSLRFCVTARERHYKLATAGAPRMRALPVTRELALLDLELGSTSTENIMHDGLHEFLREFQSRLNRVHSSIMDRHPPCRPRIGAVTQSVRYRVHWETTYEYARPAVSLHTELRVLPADRAGQRLVDGTISLDPHARAVRTRRRVGQPLPPCRLRHPRDAPRHCDDRRRAYGG